jgi:hypothetical protein
MNKIILYLLMLSGILVVHTGFAEEEIGTIATKVKEYTAAGNYTKALEELAWYKKEIEKRHFNKILEFFPEQLQGFQRQQPKSQSTVSITTIEAIYRKQGEYIKMVLTGGSGGSAGAMGGLAAFGQLAAMQQGMPGQDSFRLEGFTATLNEKQLRPELSVFIDSGWIIKFIASDTTLVRSFAEIFPLAKLNSYLKGDM